VQIEKTAGTLILSIEIESNSVVYAKKRSRHSAVSHIRLYKIQYWNSIQCSLSPRYSDVQGETEAKIEAHTCKAEASPSWSEMRPRYPKQGARPESVSTVHCILSVNCSARLHPRNLGHNRWRHCVLVYCGKISKVIMQMTEMINILAMICTSQCQWQSSCCRDSSRKKNKKCVHEAFKPETETLTH